MSPVGAHLYRYISIREEEVHMVVKRHETAGAGTQAEKPSAAELDRMETDVISELQTPPYS